MPSPTRNQWSHDIKMRRRKCRVWWPDQLLSCNCYSSLLFGWFVCSSHGSLDIVVATATPFDEIIDGQCQSILQDAIRVANENMPASLQECSTFSILGSWVVNQCYECTEVVDNRSNDLGYDSFGGKLKSSEMGFTPKKVTDYHRLCSQDNQESLTDFAFMGNFDSWPCGCRKLDQVLEQYQQNSIDNSNWIQLCCSSHGSSGKEFRRVPTFHHMHCAGDLLPACDVHVIIYEQPTFGKHHFSLSTWQSPEHFEIISKRPKWIDELFLRLPLSDLDAVLLMVNCASAANTFFKHSLYPNCSFKKFAVISMLLAYMWHSIALFVAFFFTFFYIFLHLSHRFLSCISQSLIYLMLENAFSYTWKNAYIRCCQVLYWPIFLRSYGLRLKSSVEYAHQVALRQHSIWSSICIDILLGNVFGWALLLYQEAVYSGILHLACNFTNNILRSGCVWLMGVPAGFKLNTELAGVLGMISLNAIQIWSTLWFFVSFLFQYFIEGLAIAGIIFGLTIPAAFCKDMLKLATLHLCILHWLISLIYSQQIQALASLWRLFRGRKWNPLRQRLDSYEYNVEQHVVGSLLFTPLLLLLPTTSVFYIFFSLMNVTISFICIFIEATISVLHATPYAEIFLWMWRPGRFPSGIWFELLSENDHNNATRDAVSILRSNFATLGQIIFPHYTKVFSGVTPSHVASFAYGILSGQRMPSTLGARLPSAMPWVSFSFREYLQLCHDSVVSIALDT